MADELYYQRQLIKRIVAMGGYAKKWSTRYTVGVPDLIVVLHGHTSFVEVKLEKVERLDFDRKVDLTPKQVKELHDLRVSGALAKVAIVVKTPKTAYLVIKDPPEPRKILRISSDEINCQAPYVATLSDCGELLFDLLAR